MRVVTDVCVCVIFVWEDTVGTDVL